MAGIAAADVRKHASGREGFLVTRRRPAEQGLETEMDP